MNSYNFHRIVNNHLEFSNLKSIVIFYKLVILSITMIQRIQNHSINRCSHHCKNYNKILKGNIRMNCIKYDHCRKFRILYSQRCIMNIHLSLKNIKHSSLAQRYPYSYQDKYSTLFQRKSALLENLRDNSYKMSNRCKLHKCSHIRNLQDRNNIVRAKTIMWLSYFYK